MRRSIVVYGSINLDEIYQLPQYPEEHDKVRAVGWHRGLGGSAANAATWLATDTPDVEFLGAVGDDHEGALCVEALEAASVGAGGLTRVGGVPTPRATSWVVGTDKRISIYRDPRLLREHATDQQMTLAAAAFHMHLASLVDNAGMECLQVAREAGASVSIELSGQRHDAVREVADLVFVNTDELRRTFGLNVQSMGPDDAATVVPKPGALLVVTMGGKAIFCASRQLVRKFDVAAVTEIVDRTGGGDAFAGGFLSRWLRDREIEHAVPSGLARSRQVVAQMGGSRRG